MTRQTGTGEAAKARSNGGLARLVGPLIVVSPALVLFAPSVLLLGLLMSPTIAGIVVDQTRQKYLAVTVGLLNFAFTLPALVRLWVEGHNMTAALGLAAEPSNWGLALAGGGFGWCLYLGMPAILSAYYSAKTKSRLAELRRRQAALVKNWGDEVVGSGE